jgi:hypothetical protein
MFETLQSVVQVENNVTDLHISTNTHNILLCHCCAFECQNHC